MFANVRGVKAAGREQVDLGAPNTITQISNAELKVAFYFDDRGRPTSEVFMVINGDYYLPPNSIEWCQSLRPMTKKQRELIDNWNKKSMPATLPEDDSVDVMGG
jgi:hypothetical protein